MSREYLQGTQQSIQLLDIIQAALALPKQHVLRADPCQGGAGVDVQAGATHLPLGHLLLERGVAELCACLHPQSTIPAAGSSSWLPDHLQAGPAGTATHAQIREVINGCVALPHLPSSSLLFELRTAEAHARLYLKCLVFAYEHTSWAICLTTLQGVSRTVRSSYAGSNPWAAMAAWPCMELLVCFKHACWTSDRWAAAPCDLGARCPEEFGMWLVVNKSTMLRTSQTWTLGLGRNSHLAK